MGQKYPFHFVLSAKAAAGSNDLAQEQIPDGRLYCIQRVAVENETTAYTDLRILIAGGGEEFLLVEEDNLTAATLYWMDEPAYLREGQYLVCRLSGCTANDVLKAYITGWWQEARELSDAKDRD